MTNKYFYRTILFRLLVIILLAGAISWFWFEKHSIVICALLLILLVAAVFNIIWYFNNINRWISFFLLGIENEDTTLKIPAETGNKAIDEVYKGMQRLNELFRQTKKEISSQEQYFRSVINQSATGLFSVNEKGRVININPAAIKLTKLQEYHHVNTLKNIDKALPGFILNNLKPKTRPSSIFENSQGQKLLFKLSEIKLKEESIKLVAVSDISKELDSREVDAWIKLARTLSHEIMNNIAPITTLSQVISGYYTKEYNAIKPKDVDEKTIRNTIKGLTVIEERSLGLLNFVENYRKFTKLPDPEMAEVDLIPIIENNLLAAAAFEGFNTIKLNKHLPQKLKVLTDKKLLSQVITNLLKNATEALIEHKINDPEITLRISEAGSLVRTEVANNGPVIPADLREQIFVPFFTTKEEGSGIGLSLSKQIMLSMGGDIVLSTGRTNETLFTVTLNKGAL